VNKAPGVALLAAVTLGALALSACSTPPATSGAQRSAAPPAAAPASPAAPQPTPPPTPPPAGEATTSWGVPQADWQRAGRLVARMTVERRAGQVMVATYPGLEPPTDLVRDLGLAGVILLGDNVPADPRQLAGALSALQQADPRPYPLVVAVDQEGGPVTRIGDPATPFPPAMALGAADDTALATRAAAASGREMRALGFTMVFAPVADVTQRFDPTIGVRSPGGRPALVGRIATAQAAGYAQAGVVPVLKHFPGHGSVPADSHLELPVQTATPQQLRRRDLVPFATGVAAGAPAVMVAHIDVRALDPGVPSSVSPAVVTGMLRDDLGFDGVVVTDSMLMAGVADRYGPGEGAVAALAAGADLVLMPADARIARDAIVAAVRERRLQPARLAQAARRVVALQLAQARTAQVPLEVVGTADRASRRVSAAAVTMVPGPEGRCGAPLVAESLQVVGGDEQDRALLAQAAGRAGLQVGSGTTVALLGTASATARADVVVALDAPWGLGGSEARLARLALFGRTPGAFDALVAVLEGRADAPGRLPVSVPGLDARSGCWHSP
jgi:beta-N-acetylhexosaminidase